MSEVKGLQVHGGMVRKRKGGFSNSDGKEYLEFTPLGGGQEVGRSCHILSYKGVTVMLDCGIHPGYSGMAALPFFDMTPTEIEKIDLLLVSHFHVDHAAAIPYFLQKTKFRGKVFMTYPTKAIYKLLLLDFIRVSSMGSREERLFDEKDLDNSMGKITDIDFHQTIRHKGVKFRCLHAGHVLGAAMFEIEIADVRILYTGDYSRIEDRHLMAAEIPPPDRRPDVLIVESTFGIRQLEPVPERERLFIKYVTQILRRGGRCLIPVFALGRAQELMLILEEYWRRDPSIQLFPVFYSSNLAANAITAFQSFPGMMNKRIQKQMHKGQNPFNFKFIKQTTANRFSDDGPCVLLATPGLLDTGFSRRMFERWCSDERNGIVVAGYTVAGTLIDEVLQEPDTVNSMDGHTQLELNMGIHKVSFTAHADYPETSHFIDEVQPKDIILVHGRKTEMSRMKAQLDKDKKDSNMRISTPANAHTVQIEMSGRKVARIVKSLAEQPLEDDDLLSGIIVEKDFSYTILDPSDLEQLSVASWSVQQSLIVPFPLKDDRLVHFLSTLFEVEELSPDETGSSSAMKTESDADKDSKTRSWVVQGVVKIKRTSESGHTVKLEWKSSPVNDMISDAIVSLLMSCTTDPGAVLQSQQNCCVLNPFNALNEKDKSTFIRAKDIQKRSSLANSSLELKGTDEDVKLPDLLLSSSTNAGESEALSIRNPLDFLKLYFEGVSIVEDENSIQFEHNGVPVQVDTSDPKCLVVECQDASLRLHVERVCRMAGLALGPPALVNTLSKK